MEYKRNPKGNKVVLRLSSWVKFALCVVVALYFLIVASDSYRPGDLYSPSKVLKRETFVRGGDASYVVFHILFYAYQVGLLYRFATGTYREEVGDE